MPFSFLDDISSTFASQTPVSDGTPGFDFGDLFSLSGSVGELGDNQRQDVIKTQIMLGETGHFDLGNLGGPTGWPSSDLSRGLRRYQQDRGLTVDGVMLPQGETVRSLGDDLAEMKRYRAPTPPEVDRHHSLRAQMDTEPAATADTAPQRHKPNGMAISPEGLAAIKEYEVLRDRVYPDQAGHKTIGYGHKLRPGEEAKYPGMIDDKTAVELLTKDAGEAEAAVRRLVTAPLSQQEYDALVSLTYNIGQGGLAESTVLRELNKGDYRAAAEAILMWDKITQGGQRVRSNGLVNRRNDERNLFLNGSYNSGRRKK
ncbi:MAG: lysozyme [Ferrovibrio sp.]